MALLIPNDTLSAPTRFGPSNITTKSIFLYKMNDNNLKMNYRIALPLLPKNFDKSKALVLALLLKERKEFIDMMILI